MKLTLLVLLFAKLLTYKSNLNVVDNVFENNETNRSILFFLNKWHTCWQLLVWSIFIQNCLNKYLIWSMNGSHSIKMTITPSQHIPTSIKRYTCNKGSYKSFRAFFCRGLCGKDVVLRSEVTKDVHPMSGQKRMSGHNEADDPVLERLLNIRPITRFNIWH